MTIYIGQNSSLKKLTLSFNSGVILIDLIHVIMIVS